MIKSIVRRMLLVQIFSNLASIICSFIDNIITGQFLGVQSLAVTGLVTPVSLTMVAIGSMLSAGAQIHCGKSIAVGDQKRVDSIFSTNFLFTAGLSVLICFLCILFRFQLGAMLCSGKKEVLSNETASYLVGYILGAPGILGTAILTPFLFITGHGNLQMVSVLIVTVLDFILDLLNVLVFHGGLLGMGLATAISYNLALIFLVIVLIRYRVFPLSVKGYSWNILSSLITSGLPVAVGIMSATLMVFGINRILIGASGEAAVTVFSVTYSVGNVISAITSGVGDVSRSLSGLYYGERDLDSLREMFRCLWRYSLVLCLCIGCAVILFASGIASLFVSDPGEIKDMITLGIRFYCLGLFPCCIVFSLKGMYQSTEHPVLNNIIPLLEYTTFPVLAV
ncbi:MAG: hypothetical protein IJ088_16975, partial [Clostridia bacterium]|nr:hypothetical protein [Clostridia bacterium]